MSLPLQDPGQNYNSNTWQDIPDEEPDEAADQYDDTNHPYQGEPSKHGNWKKAWE